MRRWFPWGSQPLSRCSPGAAGAQGRRVGRSCWQRCAGSGSCEQLPAGSGRSGCLGEPHTKPRLLRLPGDPCIPGSRHPEPDAGQGEPEVGAWGRALGLDGREMAGGGQSSALGRAPVAGRAGTAQPCLWLTAHGHLIPVGSNPSSGTCVGTGDTSARLSCPFARGCQGRRGLPWPGHCGGLWGRSPWVHALGEAAAPCTPHEAVGSRRNGFPGAERVNHAPNPPLRKRM